MLIVDTSVWIDYFKDVSNPHTDLLDLEISRARIGIPSLILCELLQGARNDFVAEQIRLDLSVFELVSTGTPPLAIASARNYRVLRSRGITIRNTIDCLIATTCILDRHTLLHRDRDFDPFEQHLNLNVLHPPASKTRH